MITASQMADLLRLDANLNRFAKADAQSSERAVAWAGVLAVGAKTLGFEDAQRLVLEHYAASSEPLTPHDLVARWRRLSRERAERLAREQERRHHELVQAERLASPPKPEGWYAQLLKEAKERLALERATES